MANVLSTTWPDRSPAGNDLPLVKATGAGPIEFVENWRNYLPAFWAPDGLSSWYVGINGGFDAYTVFVVGEWSADSVDRRLFVVNAFGAGLGSFGGVPAVFNDSGAAFPISAPVGPGDPFIWMISRDGVSVASRFILDQQLPTLDALNPGAMALSALGFEGPGPAGFNGWDAPVAQAIVYQRDLTPSEITPVISGLGARYSLFSGAPPAPPVPGFILIDDLGFIVTDDLGYIETT